MGKEVDRHLFSEGRKRVLCLDGGGIRGLLSVAVLERVEAILRARQPAEKQPTFVLSDYFDLIAGTSTGSIIAALLALGKTMKEVRAAYEELGPLIFSKPRAGAPVLQAKYEAGPFDAELKDALHETTLGGHGLRTGLLITCHRMDNGSAWILCNNKEGKYWRHDSTRPIRHLVRASAAAPTYFDPIILPIGNAQTGLFLDGAMSGLNNPSLATLIYVLGAEYKLGWKAGVDELFMLSVGTGYKRYLRDQADFAGKIVGFQASDALTGLIHQSSFQALMTMQALSYSTEPFILNGEVSGLADTNIAGKPLLHFERVDAPLDGETQQKDLGLFLNEAELEDLERMDNCKKPNLGNLHLIGQRYAARLKETRLPSTFDIGAAP
ncbi:patatin-like phospholipase family protein [Vitreimonas flagellata]|uniref:patatin-like phospholipase family protein n=1 Tax=Vitreimonas flagellata TaxID=2560861 RepID=UPI0010753269|nr:patatin-like phospholipase family protein [Vitreimonas flagellata]